MQVCDVNVGALSSRNCEIKCHTPSVSITSAHRAPPPRGSHSHLLGHVFDTHTRKIQNVASVMRNKILSSEPGYQPFQENPSLYRVFQSGCKIFLWARSWSPRGDSISLMPDTCAHPVRCVCSKHSTRRGAPGTSDGAFW